VSDPRHLAESFESAEPLDLPEFDEISGPRGPAQYVPPPLDREPSGAGPAQWVETA
jgi:hypothetical protein